MEGDMTIGYDILDVSSGVTAPFLKLINPEIKGVERFTQMEEGYRVGLKALNPENNRDSNLMIIDEAGPLELRGEGWARRINELLNVNEWQIILVVRKSLVDKVISKFGISDPAIYEVGSDNFDKLLTEIINTNNNG